MSKKLILVLMVVIFFSKSNLARAEVVISEFVSHPNTSIGEKEWIEIFNNSPDTQNLAGWKLTDLTTPDTKPVEEKLSDLSGILSPYPNGILVFEFSSKLNDGGDSIGLYDNLGKQIYRVTYGVVKDYTANLAEPAMSKSGALVSSVWKTNQNPTKGIQNPIPDNSPVGEAALVSDNSSTVIIAAVPETKTKVVEIPKIKTEITTKTFGFVGLPLSFLATAYGLAGEQLYYGRYFWNFGDGDSKEMQVLNSQPFTHTYFYPGEYAITLDYYQNYSDIPDASSQISIKIIKTDISIERVGDEKDFFVELSNNTDYPADISSWILISDAKSFSLPKNTILASEKTLIISPKITGLGIADKNTLKLMTPQREIVFDYGVSNSPLEEYPEVLPQEEVDNASTLSRQRATPQEGNSTAGNSNTEIPTENLLASASTSPGGSTPAISSPIIPLASLVFIGAGAGSVYFIRRKKVIPQAGNDFEILDE